MALSTWIPHSQALLSILAPLFLFACKLPQVCLLWSLCHGPPDHTRAPVLSAYLCAQSPGCGVCTAASTPSASLHAGCWQWLTSQTLCSKPSAASEPPFPLHAHTPDCAHLCPTCTSPGPLLHSSGMLPSCPPTPDELWTGKITKLPCHPVSWITTSPKRFETQPLEGGPPFHVCPSLGTLS